MSRIGLKPIPLPQGVDADVQAGVVVVKGPKGTLTVVIPPHVTVTLNPERALDVRVKNPDVVEQRALWGLARQLLANAVEGVQKPYEKALEFVGVGYKVAITGATVKMEVGFSHSVEFGLPAGIEGKVEKQVLTLSGIDKALVGETAARIRRIRPPEPYKGKGIKYVGEVIRRKAG
ncbi:MAG TPA: 50S ribosomal protein L6, partial [Candidatus Methylomirabilis sp.]|nr:50S ribosomal protein L6 [Candidatus Methylomirabilis sp.]